MKNRTSYSGKLILLYILAIMGYVPVQAAYQQSGLSNGLLTITATNATILNLKISGSNLLLEEIPGLGNPAVIRATYPVGSVRRIRYVGGAGIDILTATGVNAPMLIMGNGGNDILSGGNGNDVLIGGEGTDSMLGKNGDDTLIGIDGALGDNLDGGSNRDIYWTDFIGGRREQLTVTNEDYVQEVSQFANGADLTLDGDNLPDPQLNTQYTQGWVYGNHRDKPLFPSMGPRMSDINQRSSSDCKVVATIAGLANNTVSGNAWPVRRALADFGDGTYGVKLGTNFYRVDGDLPMNGNGFGCSAPGAESCIWPAVVEKALCYYLPRNPGQFAWQDLFSIAPHDVMLGFGAQTADSPMIGERYSSAQDLGTQVYASFNRYENVVFTLNKASTVGGVHAYTMIGVKRESNGTISSITFRNPWGNSDGNGRNGDGVQWYTDANSSDALVTFTPQQLWQDANFGRATVGSRIQ